MPEVMAIWNPMTAVLESMQLARVEPLATRGAPRRRSKPRA